MEHGVPLDAIVGQITIILERLALEDVLADPLQGRALGVSRDQGDGLASLGVAAVVAGEVQAADALIGVVVGTRCNGMFDIAVKDGRIAAIGADLSGAAAKKCRSRARCGS